MPGGEDFILRPVRKGYIKYDALKNGTIDLYDIALMNDDIDMCEDNDARIDKWRAENER